MMTPLNVGNKRQLFIDDRFVAEARGVTRRVNRPTLAGIAFSPGPEGAPDDGMTLFGAVMEDDGIYKMWADARSAKMLAGKFDDGDPYVLPLQYLTSTDGIRWEKPDLGLIEWKGRKHNNLVSLECGHVFKDPKAPANARYKMLAGGGHAFGCKTIFDVLEHPQAGVYMYTSPDGLNWTFNPTRLLPLCPDCFNQVIYDTRLKKYVAYLRCWPDGFLHGGKTYGRAVCRVELDDPMQPWPYTPREKKALLWGPTRVANIGTELPMVMSYPGYKNGWTDIYNPHVVQYPWAEDVYLAFPELNHHQPDSPIPNHSVLEVGMCVSRDGIDWQWPSTEAYIPREAKGTGRGGMLYNIAGILRKGDKLHQYHAATDCEHHGQIGKQYGYKGLLSSSRVYHTEQRLDGFVSMDFGPDGGELVTPLLQVTGKRLILNCNAAKGDLRVELRNAENKHLPGFAYADCAPVRADGTNYEVQWTNSVPLPRHSLRLAMKGRSAKVFAFEFRIQEDLKS